MRRLPGPAFWPQRPSALYCRWDRLSNGYGYTQAWVEKLIRDLSDPDKYEAVVGFRPE